MIVDDKRKTPPGSFAGRALSIFFFIGTSMLSAKSLALENRLQWYAAMKLEQTDNALLSTDSEISLVSSILSPGIDYEITAVTWSAGVEAFGNLRSSSEPELDTNDRFYSVDYRKAWQLLVLDTEISHQETSTRLIDAVEELQITNDPVSSDLVDVNLQRQLSPKDNLSLSTSYLYRDYSGDTYTDYKDWQVNGNWFRQLSETLTLQTQFYYSRYVSQRTDTAFQTLPVTYFTTANETTSQGAQVGITWLFNEYTNGHLLFGGSDIEVARDTYFSLGNATNDRFANQSMKEHTTSNLLNAQVNHHRQYSRYTVGLSQSLQASGSGFQYDTQAMNFALHRRLTQYSDFDFQASFSKQRTLKTEELVPGDLDRSVVSLNISFSQRVSPNWTLTERLNHVAIEYDASDSSAEATTATLQLKYTPNRLVW